MLSERIKPLKGLAPSADIFNTDPGSDVFSMRDLRGITFLVHHKGGTTGKGTLIAQACDDITPSSTTAIAAKYRKMTTGDSDTLGAITTLPTTGVETVPTEDTLFEIYVDATDLPADKDFVRLKLTETANDPVLGVVIALGHLKYQGVDAPTVIA